MRINDIGKESDSRVPAELREVEQRLRDDRPVLSVTEIEEIKARTQKKSATRSTNKLLASRRELS